MSDSFIILQHNQFNKFKRKVEKDFHFLQGLKTGTNTTNTKEPDKGERETYAIKVLQN